MKSEDKFYDYGNGVYFYRADVSRFGYELSKFIGEHPELKVLGISVASLGAGYFVICEKVTKP